MKRFLRVLTSTLLVIAMVLTGLPALPELEFDGSGLENIKLKFSGIAEAFAGGSSDPEIDTSSHNENLNTGSENGTPNAGRLASDTNTYILAVSMYRGATADVCQYIILKYYASEAAKKAGQLSTQYLDPSANNIFGEDIVSGSGFINGDYGFLGSKKTSYSNFSDNAAWLKKYYEGGSIDELNALVGSGGTGYKLGSTSMIKAYSQYHSWANTVTEGAESDIKKNDILTKYKTVDQKIDETSLQAASTEYFRFKFEYGFYELEDLEFYCEANSEQATATFSFGISGWALYKHDGEFDSNGNYINGATQLCNYAFVSDSLGLCFNGTRLYESVSYVDGDDSTLDYPDTRNIIGEGGAVYTFKNVADMDKYDDYNNGFSNIYFFRKCTGDTKRTTDSKTILNFAIRIADSYGAGIDAYVLAKHFTECLEATIIYQDTGGSEQMVGLPVMTNALLEFAVPVDEDPYEKNSAVYQSELNGQTRIERLINSDYLCFAQQSDTIYFSVEFPDFGSLTSIELEYSPLDPYDDFMIEGIDVYDNAGNNQYALRNKYIDNTEDQSAIDITLPTGEDSTTGINVVYRNTAEYNYTTLTFDNHNCVIEFAPADKVVLPSSSYVGKYVVTLHSEEIYDELSNICSNELFYEFSYEDLDGNTKYTALSSLKEAINDFYGYNLGKVTTTGLSSTGAAIDNLVSYDADAQYYYSMSNNHTAQFILYAKDVKNFKTMKISFKGPEATDEETVDGAILQFDSIKIEKLYDQSVVGKRISSKADADIELGHAASGYSRITARNLHISQIFSRTITGTDVIYDSGTQDALYSISPGYETVFSFESGSSDLNGTDNDEDEEDGNAELKNGMSYIEALKDTKLGESKVTFTVQVAVSGNKEATRTDDCGSNNRFYFQLLFAEKGDAHQTSAYVLANQQLTADGFRSGYEESFDINVNENVGDVTGVNIIVDSVSSDSDSSDKLKVDSITVVRNNDTNIDKCFVIENVGWIDTQYGEEGEVGAQETRSAEDIEQYFGVSYSTYMLELEFALTWGSYATDSEGMNVFIGNLLADLNYVTSDGTSSSVKTLSSIQCVAGMAEYCGRTAQSDETLTYVSDSSYIFRPQHTNRFIVSIKGITKLNSIRFKAYADGYSPEQSISIKSMSVFINTAVGYPQYAKNGDIMRNYPADSQYLYCDTFSPSLNQPYTITAMADTSAGSYAAVFKFKDCKDIPDMSNDDEQISSVNRVPASSNDKLNVYFYMEEGTPGPKTDPLNKIYGTIEYTLANSINYGSIEIEPGDWMERTETVGEGTDASTVTVVYVEGLSASKMAGIANVVLKAPGNIATERQKYRVSYCIIQQLRGDTIVDTFKCNFATEYYGMFQYGSSMLGGATSSSLGYTQTVTLQLAADSYTADLVAEKYDIACALEYSTLIAGQDKVTYISPYVYATDSGVSRVHPGSILEFDFNVAYLGKVSGIRLYSMNGLKTSAKAATVKTFITTEESNKAGEIVYSTEQTELYSIIIGEDSTATTDSAIDISTGIVSLPISATSRDEVNSLKRANITFNIMEDSDTSIIDSAGSTKVRAKIVYQNTMSQTATVEIPDITQYTVGGEQFTPGASAMISTFLKGAEDLLYIVLEPYDEDETHTAALNLKSVVFQLDDVTDTAEHTAMVGETILEDSPLSINLSKIIVSLTVTYRVEGIGTQTVTKDNDTIEVVTNEGEEVTISPVIKNDTSNSGYVIRKYKVIDNAKMLVEEYASNKETITIPARNGTDENVTWLVEISAAAVPTEGGQIQSDSSTKTNSIKSYVNIVVIPGETKATVGEDTDNTTETAIEYTK